ncbi:hypothetical protein PRIPAC_94297, partial [Pristionchus pacificus]|uniref:Uncharacterized protein n=1 Tax=Pristionchus pacificus TaxID=54126 RepID=A0A2A6BBE5_PRIPA
KHEELSGYRLEIINSLDVVLKEKRISEDEKVIQKIHVENGKQKVGIPNRIRGEICWKWFHSKEALPNSHQQHYNIVLLLLVEIKWKVAKVIFHNSSVCRGGTIRLMENGDMRMKDERGVLYNIIANSNEVFEGNPKKPSGPVNDPAKRQEILKYRDLCKETEAMIEKLGFIFPFVSSEITSVYRDNNFI